MEKQIASFPIGSVGQKQVNGKIYYYHRFREDGKRREKYIPESEVAALQEQIEQRKVLEMKLKEKLAEAKESGIFDGAVAAVLGNLHSKQRAGAVLHGRSIVKQFIVSFF